MNMRRNKISKPSDNFFENVYEVVKCIPKGRVTTYGAIAHFLGITSGARMVGWALHGAHKRVPAHRVVNKAGLLTGQHHFKGPNSMQKLLEKEGVTIVDHQIQHFDAIFWDPARELALD